METKQGTHRQDGGVALGRRYLRCQEAGLTLWLATPVMGILAEMYGVAHRSPQIAVLMVIVGAIIFAIGYYGRQELKHQKSDK